MRRADFKDATDAEMDEDLGYGKLLNTVQLYQKDGSILSVHTANPFALLYKAFAQGGSFTELVMESVLKTNCTPEDPWDLIIYADEVVPGVALSNNNRRKVWVHYMSFLQFGPMALQQDLAWLPLAVVRSNAVTPTAAGVSQLYGAILEHMFTADDRNLHLGGIVLEHEGLQVRLWAKLGMILQDGGAHKVTFHCKGDSGCRFCMVCRNLVAHNSNVTAGDDGEVGILKTSLVFFKDTDLATDEESEEHLTD